MNATAIAQATVAKAMSPPPVRRPEPELADRATGSLQRLTVWEERARKMGFPPSAR